VHRVPQSTQSEPRAQKANSAPSPPSSQMPSEIRGRLSVPTQLSRQMQPSAPNEAAETHISNPPDVTLPSVCHLIKSPACISVPDGGPLDKLYPLYLRHPGYVAVVVPGLHGNCPGGAGGAYTSMKS